MPLKSWKSGSFLDWVGIGVGAIESRARRGRPQSSMPPPPCKSGVLCTLSIFFSPSECFCVLCREQGFPTLCQRQSCKSIIKLTSHAKYQIPGILLYPQSILTDLNLWWPWNLWKNNMPHSRSLRWHEESVSISFIYWLGVEDRPTEKVDWYFMSLRSLSISATFIRLIRVTFS